MYQGVLGSETVETKEPVPIAAPLTYNVAVPVLAFTTATRWCQAPMLKLKGKVTAVPAPPGSADFNVTEVSLKPSTLPVPSMLNCPNAHLMMLPIGVSGLTQSSNVKSELTRGGRPTAIVPRCELG